MAGKSKTKSAAKRRNRPREEERLSADGKDTLCPIVGIGGSAGGFEATMDLLRHLPPTTDLVFVVVQHLDPHHASRLADLLGKATQMPVMEIRSRTIPKPNTVYVQPPNKCVVVKDGSLNLIRRTERINLTIDHFFESLAEQRGARAVGVILSGAGSDGTAGLRAIKVAGGLTFAQDEESAKFPDMPRSAARSGFVDAVLTPREIAHEIRHIVEHPYLRRPMTDGEREKMFRVDQKESDDMNRIFLSLQKETGVDFTTYKPGTVRRRIHRRMALRKLDRLNDYARYLRDNKKEVEALFDDLRINVTRFFRDPGIFAALKKRFLPKLLKNKKRQAELRIWVPGCATGEEVYSLAIIILETLGRRASEMRIQLFGTDLSEGMIDHARAGLFSSAIEKDVSPARLTRFFTKRDHTYQIGRRVRDLCTFARQNVVTDPPFSRLDLISCRNVLIYLGLDLHKRCIPQFHHALNPNGYLILGPAESVGGFERLFDLVDRKNKIYAKKQVPTPAIEIPRYQDLPFLRSGRQPVVPSTPFSSQLLQMADHIMLGAYAPAAVVIDSDLLVHQFRGRTNLYLSHAPGTATLNLLHLVKPNLVADLRTTIRRAIRTKKPARRDRALMKINGRAREINIQVVPFKVPGSEQRWLLVIFDETTAETKPGKKLRLLGKTAPEHETEELRRELAATKESLQAIIEEQEATNEELKSANEEIESSNEELQSTNEELETTKEELQSTNEELTTLNEELSNRNLEVMQLNGSLNSLLDSIQLPIVLVDNELMVRRATPAARYTFNVRESDVGRQLSELKPNFSIPDLEQLLREVIDSLVSRERMVRDAKGRPYSLRIRPYRTAENRIEGAVLTLVDPGIDSETQKRPRQLEPRPKEKPTRVNL